MNRLGNSNLPSFNNTKSGLADDSKEPSEAGIKLLPMSHISEPLEESPADEVKQQKSDGGIVVSPKQRSKLIGSQIEIGGEEFGEKLQKVREKEIGRIKQDYLPLNRGSIALPAMRSGARTSLAAIHVDRQKASKSVLKQRQVNAG